MTRGVNALLLILFLIALNAFFAASEMALVSLPPSRVRFLKKNKAKESRTIGLLLEDPSRLLSTIQVGVTLAGFLASATAAVTIGESLAGMLLGLWPGLAKYEQTLSVIISTILVSYLTLVGGELVPKRIALQNPEAWAQKLARPLLLFSKLFTPVIWSLTKSTNLILKALGLEMKASTRHVSEDELRMLVSEQPTMEQEEKKMINGVFKFGEREAQEVMTPRTEIKSIPEKTTIREALRIIAETGFSRLPVDEGSLDQIIGFVSAKDLVKNLLENNDSKVTEVLRPVYFVYETKKALELLEEMREKRVPLTIVVDEYGGTAGLITVSDLLEEIVGEIRDEFDLPVDDEIKKLNDRQFIISGQFALDELEEFLGLNFPPDARYETVAGLLMTHFGRIPNKGEEIVISGVRFRVEAVQGPRVRKVKISLEKAAAQE
ncbi:MAG: HlyC/CorC family transporter [Firmicutes bacterium]|nr:HlyC/CorC family transporter [Bacillota bacterium]